MPPRIFDLPALRLEVADSAWLGAEDAGRLVLIKRTRALTATVILSPLSAPEVAAAGDLSGLSLHLDGDPAGRTLRAAGSAQAIRSLSLICRWIELRPDLDAPEAGARFYSAILREERHAHGVRADVMIAPAPGVSGWEAQGSAQLREIQGLLKRATIKDAPAHAPAPAPAPAPARGRDPADGAGLAGQRLWSASSHSEGGSGYVREEIYSFYKDRTLLYQRTTTVSVSVPGLPGAGLGGGVREHRARGRWVSDADSVTVRFEDGTIRTWALRLTPGGATLDGEFYRRGPLG